MKKYGEFHDGLLDGILIARDIVYVFVSTTERHHFVVKACGVVALSANHFKEGNIILDVVTRQHEEFTLQDIADVYGLSELDGVDESQRRFRQANEQNLILLEINPSYGASCLILAKSIELLHRNEHALYYPAAT